MTMLDGPPWFYRMKCTLLGAWLATLIASAAGMSQQNGPAWIIVTIAGAMFGAGMAHRKDAR